MSENDHSDNTWPAYDDFLILGSYETQCDGNSHFLAQLRDPRGSGDFDDVIELGNQGIPRPSISVFDSPQGCVIGELDARSEGVS
jgi:hypothetical protein